MDADTHAHATRLLSSLRRAERDGEWNPCDDGRFAMRMLADGLAIPVDDADQIVMRDAMLGVHVSDALVLLRGEVLAGLMPAYVLDRPVACATILPLRATPDGNVGPELLAAA